MNKLITYILESPGWKTLFSAVLPIISGVLAGTFVTEITMQDVLHWKNFYRSPSFYGLLFLSTIMYWYNLQLYKHERQLNQFLDEDYCTAYMRSKCLPEAAKRYSELIRNGNGGELKQAMDELRKILK